MLTNTHAEDFHSSYISVIISISLVLFVLGIFGMLILNVGTVTRQVKENYAIIVLLKNDSPQLEIRQFQKGLKLSPFVKTTEFVSKEAAAEELKKELEEDFLEFLGYNPLLDAIEIRLNAEYVNPEQLAHLEREYTKNSFVKEVVYDKPLIQMMNENVEKIGLILIGGCVLLSLIAIGLINSSIRLSIYSRRFLIKTMQLVGATKGFICKPFIWRSLRHGILGAIIALILLAVLSHYISRNIPDIVSLQNTVYLALLVGAIILIGMIISMSCTFFALRKYLNLKSDQLHF